MVVNLQTKQRSQTARTFGPGTQGPQFGPLALGPAREHATLCYASLDAIERSRRGERTNERTPVAMLDRVLEPSGDSTDGLTGELRRTQSLP
jgi:hypothetical protein